MEKEKKAGNYGRFLMYIIIVILINLVGMTFFLRMDFTRNKMYSLSPASKKAVALLAEPLTIKVFQSETLPSRYGPIRTYIRDLLDAFARAGNRNFNYEFYTISSGDSKKSQEEKDLANSYGIHSFQDQDLKEGEFKFFSLYLGMVLIQGDVVETIPQIMNSNGMEYEITSRINKMNSKISSLLSLKQPIDVDVILSSSLKELLQDTDKQLADIEKIVTDLNVENYGKLKFAILDPSQDKQAEEIARSNAVRKVQWRDRGQDQNINFGYAGIMVKHQQEVEVLDLIQVAQVLTASGIASVPQFVDTGNLSDSIRAAIDTVIKTNQEVGYLADYGTLPLQPPQNQSQNPLAAPPASYFKQIAQTFDYNLKQVSLKQGSLPEGFSTLVIAGARQPLSDYALYQIDQFLMQGRTLLVFQDSFNEILPSQSQMAAGQQPVYLPIDNGLNKLLEHYGVKVDKSYVMDEKSFKLATPAASGGGETTFYPYPVLTGNEIDQTMPFLKNLKNILVYRMSPVTVDAEKIKQNGLDAFKLLSSSSHSWVQKDKINLQNMQMIFPPSQDQMQSYPLAWSLEGKFESYFKGKKIPQPEVDEKTAQKGAGVSGAKEVEASRFVEKGKKGRIIVIGSSSLIEDQFIRLLTQNDQVARKGYQDLYFIVALLDYANERQDLAALRNKMNIMNPIENSSGFTQSFVKFFNIAILPLLVLFAGFLVWVRLKMRKKAIQLEFSAPRSAE